MPIVDALVCLTSTFRSQGFSPSQRFHPGTPSWLYFKPHPPIGFMGLQSFSRRGQPWCLSALSALLPSGAPRHTPDKPMASAAREASVRQAGPTALDTPPETLDSELCSDRASDTPHDESTSGKAAALLAFFLSEAYQLDRWV